MTRNYHKKRTPVVCEGCLYPLFRLAEDTKADKRLNVEDVINENSLFLENGRKIVCSKCLTPCNGFYRYEDIINKEDDNGD